MRDRVFAATQELLEQEPTAALGRGKPERAAGEPDGGRSGTCERQMLGGFGSAVVEAGFGRSMAKDGFAGNGLYRRGRRPA